MEPAPAAARDQGVRLLADGWRAAAADDRLRRSYTDHDFDAAAWQTVTVPGHWRPTPAFADSHGPLLYRCRFDAAAPPAGRRAGLTFDGLFFQGDCWLDGATSVTPRATSSRTASRSRAPFANGPSTRWPSR